MEEEVIDWLIDNPILYAKGLREYKDSADVGDMLIARHKDFVTYLKENFGVAPTYGATIG